MTKLLDMRLTGTTNGTGAATITGEHAILGRLYAVRWIDGTLADAGQGVLSYTAPDGVSTTLLTLANPLANADAMFYPRHVIHDNAGAASTTVFELPLIDGVPALAITSGGDTRIGGCILYVLVDL
jgi:hypothetical protein